MKNYESIKCKNASSAKDVIGSILKAPDLNMTPRIEAELMSYEIPMFPRKSKAVYEKYAKFITWGL